ncbi:MAG: pyridoxal-phosphate-dependent aminotransferase family protein, partial [Candidatus Micrarchaeia archaeon]
HEKLKQIYKTNQNVFILTSSGTGAVECGLLNVVDRDDKVLVVENGDFGSRLFKQASLYSDNVEVLKFEYGKGAVPEQVKAEIDKFKPDVFAIVHNDTSTALENKVRDVSSYASDAGALIFVDSVSGLAGTQMDFDGWKIDVCASGAQKCIGGPAGLSFVAASDKALEKARRIPQKSHYFNFGKFAKNVEKSQTPNTPAVYSFYSLQVALSEVLAEGLDARIARHKQLSGFVQKSLENLGFELFTEEGYRSQTVTAFKHDKIEDIRKALSVDCGFFIAGGQADLKGKIGRVANMANITQEDLQVLMEALEACKKKAEGK